MPVAECTATAESGSAQNLQTTTSLTTAQLEMLHRKLFGNNKKGSAATSRSISTSAADADSMKGRTFKFTTGGRSQFSFSPPRSLLSNVKGGSLRINYGESSPSYKSAGMKRCSKKWRSASGPPRARQALGSNDCGSSDWTASQNTRECFYLSPFKDNHGVTEREVDVSKSKVSTRSGASSGSAGFTAKPRFKITTFGSTAGKKRSTKERISSASSHSTQARKNNHADENIISWADVGNLILKHIDFRPIKDGQRDTSECSLKSKTHSCLKKKKANASFTSVESKSVKFVEPTRVNSEYRRVKINTPTSSLRDSPNVQSEQDSELNVIPEYAIDSQSAPRHRQKKTMKNFSTDVEGFEKSQMRKKNKPVETIDKEIAEVEKAMKSLSFVTDDIDNTVPDLEVDRCSSCKGEGSPGTEVNAGSTTSTCSCKAVRNYIIHRKRSRSCGYDRRSTGEAPYTNEPILHPSSRYKNQNPPSEQNDVDAEKLSVCSTDHETDKELQDVLELSEDQRAESKIRSSSHPSAFDRRRRKHCSTPYYARDTNQPGEIAKSRRAKSSSYMPAELNTPQSHSSPSSFSKSASSETADSNCSTSSDNGSSSFALVLDEISRERLQHEFDLRLGKYMSLLCSETVDSPAAKQLQARLKKQRRNVGFPANSCRKIPSSSRSLKLVDSKKQSQDQHNATKVNTNLSEHIQKHTTETPTLCIKSDTATQWSARSTRNVSPRRELSPSEYNETCCTRPPMPRRPHSSPAKSSDLTKPKQSNADQSGKYLLEFSPGLTKQESEELQLEYRHGAQTEGTDTPRKLSYSCMKRSSPLPYIDRSGQTTPIKERSVIKCKPPLGNSSAQTEGVAFPCSSSSCRLFKNRSATPSFTNAVFRTAPSSPSPMVVPSFAETTTKESDSVGKVPLLSRISTPEPKADRTYSVDDAIPTHLEADTLGNEFTCEDGTAPTTQMLSDIASPKDTVCSENREGETEYDTIADSTLKRSTTPIENKTSINIEISNDCETPQDAESAQKVSDAQTKVEDELQKYNAVMNRCRMLLNQQRMPSPNDDEDSGSWTHVSEEVDPNRQQTTPADVEVDITKPGSRASNVNPDTGKEKLDDATKRGASLGDSALKELGDLVKQLRLETVKTKGEKKRRKVKKSVKKKNNARRRSSSATVVKKASRLSQAGSSESVRKCSSNSGPVEVIHFGCVDTIKRLANQPSPDDMLKTKVKLNKVSSSMDSINTARLVESTADEATDTQKKKKKTNKKKSRKIYTAKKCDSEETVGKDNQDKTMMKHKSNALKEKKVKLPKTKPEDDSKSTKKPYRRPVSREAKKRFHLLINRPSIEDNSDSITPVMSKGKKDLRFTRSSNEKLLENESSQKPRLHTSRRRHFKPTGFVAPPSSRTSWKALDSETPSPRLHTPLPNVLDLLEDVARLATSDRPRKSLKTKTKVKSKPKQLPISPNKEKQEPDETHAETKTRKSSFEKVHFGKKIEEKAHPVPKGSGLDIIKESVEADDVDKEAEYVTRMPALSATTKTHIRSNVKMGEKPPDSSPKLFSIQSSPGSIVSLGERSIQELSTSEKQQPPRVWDASPPWIRPKSTSSTATSAHSSPLSSRKRTFSSSKYDSVASSSRGFGSFRLHRKTSPKKKASKSEKPEEGVEAPSTDLTQSMPQIELEELEKYRKEFMAFKNLSIDAEGNEKKCSYSCTVLRKCSPLLVAVFIKFLVSYTTPESMAVFRQLGWKM